MLDRLNAKRRRDMGLAGSWAADKDDVVGAADELAAVQAPRQSLVDFAGGKIKSGQILVSREAGGLDLISDRPDFALLIGKVCNMSGQRSV
jgi:hypothetical protein